MNQIKPPRAVVPMRDYAVGLVIFYRSHARKTQGISGNLVFFGC